MKFLILSFKLESESPTGCWAVRVVSSTKPLNGKFKVKKGESWNEPGYIFYKVVQLRAIPLPSAYSSISRSKKKKAPINI